MSLLMPISDRQRHANRSMRSSIASGSDNISMNSSYSMGSAAKKDAKSIKFDLTTPLDTATAINSLSNKNKEFYYRILVKFLN